MSTILKDRLELLDALKLRNKCCAEIGVLHGDFSAEILARNPFDLYLVDPWLKQDYFDFNMLTRNADEFNELHVGVVNRFKENQHVHVMRMFSHEGAREINRQFDFVYIDARHDFSNVLSDLFLWTPKMKPDGVIALHDYGNSTFYGVEQAVDKYCEITGYEIVFETSEQWFTSCAIRIK